MVGRTHVILGTATLLYITSVFYKGLDLGLVTVQPAIGLVTVAIGSLAPDIDHQQTKLGREHPFISSLLTHRGITHTLLIPAIVCVLMYMIARATYELGAIPSKMQEVITAGIRIGIPSLLFGFLVGYLAHLIADMFNPTGVPILWPIILTRISVGRVRTMNTRTGEHAFGERMFTLLWIGGLLAWRLLSSII